MSRMLKEINRAIKENDFSRMQKLGKADFETTGKHLTGRDGVVVHKGQC